MLKYYNKSGIEIIWNMIDDSYHLTDLGYATLLKIPPENASNLVSRYYNGEPLFCKNVEGAGQGQEFKIFDKHTLTKALGHDSPMLLRQWKRTGVCETLKKISGWVKEDVRPLNLVKRKWVAVQSVCLDIGHPPFKTATILDGLHQAVNNAFMDTSPVLYFQNDEEIIYPYTQQLLDFVQGYFIC